MISRDLVASQLGEEAKEVVSRDVRKIINSAFFEYPGPRLERLNVKFLSNILFGYFQYFIHILHSLRIQMHFPLTYLSQD